MENSSSVFLLDCLDPNLSRDSVTSEYWDSSTDHRSSGLAIAILFLIFLFVGLPGNIIIIVNIIHRKLYKETTHILLLNLAISDFLVCFLVMPPTIISGFAGGYVFGSSDYVRCQVCQMGLITTALTLVSVYTLSLISLDRFVFIKFPLRYDSYVTVSRVISCLIATWVFSIFVALLPYSRFGGINFALTTSTCILNFSGGLNNYNIIYAALTVVLCIIPVALTIVINIWFACIVRKQIAKIYFVRKSMRNNRVLRSQSIRMQAEATLKRRHAKQLTLVRVFGAILIANFVVWFPLAIFVVVKMAVEEDQIPEGINLVVYLCLLAHSIIHPLIEGCLIPEIKSTLSNILSILICWKFCKKNHNPEATLKRDDDVTITTDDHNSPMGTVNYIDICSAAVLTSISSEPSSNN